MSVVIQPDHDDLEVRPQSQQVSEIVVAVLDVGHTIGLINRGKIQNSPFEQGGGEGYFVGRDLCRRVGPDVRHEVDRLAAVPAEILAIVKRGPHDHTRIWGAIFKLPVETNLLVLVKPTKVPPERREEVHVVIVILKDGGGINMTVEPVDLEELLPFSLVELSQGIRCLLYTSPSPRDRG